MAGFNSNFTGNQLEDILKFFYDEEFFQEKITDKGIVIPFEEELEGEAILCINNESTNKEQTLLIE